MNEKRKVIGIDFGSSQSSIAIMDIGSNIQPELLNVGGGRNGQTMPTVLALDKNDDTLRAAGNEVRLRYKEVADSSCKLVSDFLLFLFVALLPTIGNQTKTSSDASQEAPERARKDTPKEANCISRAASLLCVFTSVVSQAFLRRVPSPQGLGYCSSPPCAGNLFYHGGIGIHPCPATASYCTTKSGLRRKTPHVRIRRRRPIRALSAGRSL